jgi:DMSO/TMAO reductase YedYZ heme-binding membrane subunit
MARRGTSGRSDGSTHVRPRARVSRAPGGLAGMRLTGLVAVWTLTVSLVGGLSAATPLGRDISAAVVRFLLFYGGVFALIALTAAGGVGHAATDRIVMSPGRRVTAQAIHRAVSLAALAFLVIHILLEIAAERSQPLDAIVPFLAQGRTFYIGLGTIASDLILVIVASGFLRSRFARSGRPWAWRAVHASAYLSWLLSILHGLLGGRTAKPYVDWSYGACVAAVALALAIRMVATTRSREEVALAAGDESAFRSPWPSLPPALAGAAGPSQLMLGLPAGRALPPGPSTPRPGPGQDTGGLPVTAGGLPVTTNGLPGTATGPVRPAPGRHRSPAQPIWDSLAPGGTAAGPAAAAAPAPQAGIRAFDDRPRPGNSPGSVWVGIRQPDAVSPPGDPWAHLRSAEDPWAGLQPGYPYPSRRSQHHLAPEPGGLPESPGADGLSRRTPRVAPTYGGQL